MAEGIMGLIDSMPDEGPPADAGDTSSPNFGQGMSIPQMYEILMPLARRLAEQTGEDVQSILQEMVTDPTAIGRAKSMLGMDETTPFPNNIREPMTLKPGEVLMNSDGEVLGQKPQERTMVLKPGQVVVDAAGNVIAQEEQSLVTLKPGELVVDSSGRVISDAPQGPPPEAGISPPPTKPTMSERLLDEMSLKEMSSILPAAAGSKIMREKFPTRNSLIDFLLRTTGASIGSRLG